MFPGFVPGQVLSVYLITHSSNLAFSLKGFNDFTRMVGLGPIQRT